jgi:hypothetical protein
MTPKFSETDTVVLVDDVDAAGLRAGDLGAIVLVHDARTYEVEFVTAAGRTRSLVTLTEKQLRAINENDLLTVRSVPTERVAAH